MAVITSPADVVNLALSRLGRDDRVGNLFEGSAAAKQALDIYGETRDAVLCELDWDFAERNATATLLKTAPALGYFPPTVWNPAANPPMPWFFEYAYPADCLKVRALRPPALLIPNFDPKPVLFNVANDTVALAGQPSAPGRVILTNQADALLVYTGRVTDPTAWKPPFIEALAAALARRMAQPGAQQQAESQDESTALVVAAPERG